MYSVEEKKGPGCRGGGSRCEMTQKGQKEAAVILCDFEVYVWQEQTFHIAFLSFFPFRVLLPFVLLVSK